MPPRKTYPGQDFSYSGAPEQSNQNSLPENGVSFAKFHFFPLFKMNKLPFDERIIKWVDICCNKRTSPIDSQSHGLQIRNGYYLFISLILKKKFIPSLIIMKQTALNMSKLLNLKISKLKVKKIGDIQSK